MLLLKHKGLFHKFYYGISFQLAVTGLCVHPPNSIMEMILSGPMQSFGDILIY